MTTTVNSAADTGLPDALLAEESLDLDARIVFGLSRLTAAQRREFAAKLQADGHPELQPLAEAVLKMADDERVAV